MMCLLGPLGIRFPLSILPPDLSVYKSKAKVLLRESISGGLAGPPSSHARSRTHTTYAVWYVDQ